MAPLPLLEVTTWIVTPISGKMAIQVAALLNMPITKQNVVNFMSKSYSGMLGNVEVTIPIIATEPDIDIPNFEEGINYTEIISSRMSDYNLYKKLSRYIVAYMLWLYSSYLYNKEDISMYKFQEKYIKIDPNFVYGHVGKVFSRESGVMSKGQLVVKSTETLKRLMYVLRLENKDKILSYHTRTVIENYYSDITDFDQYQTQVILQGEQSVEKWINEHLMKHYELYDSIQLDHDYPYFFKNNLVEDVVWLAQNTDTMDNAIGIWSTWYNEKYNPGYTPISVYGSDYIFSLYSYRNKSDIKKYTVGKGLIVDTLKIMAYKVNDQTLYTVLLPL